MTLSKNVDRSLVSYWESSQLVHKALGEVDYETIQHNLDCLTREDEPGKSMQERYHQMISKLKHCRHNLTIQEGRGNWTEDSKSTAYVPRLEKRLSIYIDAATQ